MNHPRLAEVNIPGFTSNNTGDKRRHATLLKEGSYHLMAEGDLHPLAPEAAKMAKAPALCVSEASSRPTKT